MTKSLYKDPSAWSIGLIFMFLNIAFGSWLSRLPEIQSNLSLSEGVLGLVLLGMPLGALLSTSFSRFLIERIEPGRLALVALLLFTGSMIAPTLALDAWSLAILLFVAGLTDGTLNVSMNTAASTIEHNAKIKIMSSCHGMFSLGGFIGALIGGVFGKMGISLFYQMSLIFLVAAVSMLLRKRHLWDLSSNISKNRQPIRWPSWRLLAFMFIGVFIMIGEGAISDWSAIYLSTDLNAGPLVAALGFAGFSAAMAFGRFSGDRIRNYFRPKLILRNGTLIAVAGLALVIFAQTTWLVIIGFTLAGIGFATGVPILFLEAGKLNPKNPGIGIAAVANAGIIGFLGAPPAIGFIAEHYGLNTAFVIVAALALIAAVGSHFSFSK